MVNLVELEGSGGEARSWLARMRRAPLPPPSPSSPPVTPVPFCVTDRSPMLPPLKPVIRPTQTIVPIITAADNEHLVF